MEYLCRLQNMIIIRFFKYVSHFVNGLQNFCSPLDVQNTTIDIWQFQLCNPYYYLGMTVFFFVLNFWNFYCVFSILNKFWRLIFILICGSFHVFTKLIFPFIWFHFGICYFINPTSNQALSKASIFYPFSINPILISQFPF